jgi:hypothetical protein
MEVLTDTWIIAKQEDNSIVHYGFAATGTRIDTGQPQLLEYESEVSWVAALVLLGIDPFPQEPNEPAEP